MAKLREPENLLLAALPDPERERLDPFLYRVQLEAGQPITEPDEPIENLYFPYDAVTSTVQEMSDGSTIETGLMGIEGLAGVQVWLRQRTTASTTFVQVPGSVHRMSTADFIREVRDRPSPLNDLVAAYLHAFLVLTSMVAACNRLHPIDERLCRWLRMTYNRARRTEFRCVTNFWRKCSEYTGLRFPRRQACCRRPDSSITAMESSPFLTLTDWSQERASATL